MAFDWTTGALGAGISAGLSQGYSSGGSVNSAQNYAYNNSGSYSQTNAAQAQTFSAEQAALAYQRQQALMQAQMDFNREEAQKERDWQAEMANTIYTRSVKNMKEAGINPILAAGMGLSGASVGSGATASISGAQAPMAQSFMDTTSASSGGGESFGESHGSSWNNSEQGFVTFLNAMGDLIGAMTTTVASGQAVEALTNFINNMFPNDDKYGRTKVEEIMDNPMSLFKNNKIIPKISGLYQNQKRNDTLYQDSKNGKLPRPGTDDYYKYDYYKGW